MYFRINYSKMDNQGSWTYCKTFWVIFGAFQTRSIMDPRTAYLLQKDYKKYKRNIQTSFEHVISHISIFWKFKTLKFGKYRTSKC